MNEKFVVDGAICTCKFGTTPGKMKVTDQQFVHINGQNLLGTSMNLGCAFYPPYFTLCRVTWPPKPCVPSILQWTNTFTKVKVDKVAALLTDRSKAACALGGPECISFIFHGQIPMPVTMVQHPLMELLDPTGEQLINGQPMDCLDKIIIE